MRNEPEYYLDCGYEDHGYVSPELSSSDEYPDYIKEEVWDSIRKIQSHQTTDTITFAFMTDLHLALSYNHEVRMRRTVNAYKEIAKRVHIDKLMMGGDYTNEGCKEYKADCYRELRAHFSGIDYFPVHGNHDDGTIWDDAYIKADKATNHFTHEELYTLFYNHIPYKGGEFDKNNHSLYYKVDDPIKKLRYICIDTGDIPYKFDKSGKLVYHGQWLFSLSQKQVNWLINDALKFDEDCWSVAFFMHSVLRPGHEEKEITRHLSVLTDIVDAYKKGEEISKSYYEDEPDFKLQVNTAFASSKKADVIGFFVGDYHIDAVEKSSAGIPYILTGNAVMYYASYNPNSLPREDGDKSELLFDVMTINRKERTIHITRVGAGEDRIVKY